MSWLREGNANTRFFHAATMLRRARNRIWSIKKPNGEETEDLKEIREVCIDYFKEMWKAPALSDAPDLSQYIARITDEDNQRL